MQPTPHLTYLAPAASARPLSIATPTKPEALARAATALSDAPSPLPQRKLAAEKAAAGDSTVQQAEAAAAARDAAADVGIAEAQYNIAVMYSESMGLRRDLVRAAIRAQ